MKFTVSKEHLDYALAISERFTGKNINLPILGNILIETYDDKLIITATNLEYAIEISIPAKIQNKGKSSVPAKIINQLIQTIKEDKINFEEKQGNLLIKTDSRQVKINGTPADDFPLIPKIKKSFTSTIDPFALFEGLNKVIPAVSQSEFKPELNGILFRFSSNQLTLASTDTFRLAENVLKLPEKIDSESVSFIVPSRVSQELSRILGTIEEQVKISFGDNQILIETPNIKIVSRLIEGNFPEYGVIIPKNFKTSSFVKKNDLVNAIRSSSIFSSKLQEVSLNFDQKNNLEIIAANPEVGENKTNLNCRTSGEEIRLSFNYRFLLDGLSVLEEEEVFFGCNEENTPVLLRNKSDQAFNYVVMPIKS